MKAKRDKPARISPLPQPRKPQALDILERELAYARDDKARLMTMLDSANKIITDLARELKELKRDGFQPRAPKPKKHKVKPPEESDEMLVRKRDAEAIAKMTADFVQQGASPAAARKEAERIRQESTRTTVHPSDQA